MTGPPGSCDTLEVVAIGAALAAGVDCVGVPEDVVVGLVGFESVEAGAVVVELVLDGGACCGAGEALGLCELGLVGDEAGVELGGADCVVVVGAEDDGGAAWEDVVGGGAGVVGVGEALDGGGGWTVKDSVPEATPPWPSLTSK